MNFPGHRDSKRSAVLIIDGGTGSQLQRRAVPIDPTAWHAGAALSHYPTLVSVHAEFIRAGADVITTNTFATHRYVLDAAGLGTEFVAINRASVGAALEAREREAADVAIAGSMSCLPPRFDTANYPDEHTERAAYRELADTLAGLGVDLIALEMMQDPIRGAWALQAARATGLPVWLGVSCRPDASGQRLVGFDLGGIELEETLAGLIEPGLAAVNIMHTPCEAVDSAIAILRKLYDGPFGVYPEAGAFDTSTRTRTQSISPQELASRALGWRDAGARLTGGCCGTGPAHIAAITEALRRTN